VVFFTIVVVAAAAPTNLRTMVSTKTAVAAALLASTSNAFVAPNFSSVRSSTTSLNAIRRGGRGPRGPVRKTEYRPPMNEEIQQNELRVNVATKDGKDEPLGILSKAEALAKAKELGGLDLILINDNSDPPVCKIVDYSKYRYAQEKKRKEKAKNSKATEIKEVKMSYKIGEHDYDVRLKAATKFIKQGNRVKATVQFRGREIQHDKLGFDLLERLADDLDGMANMEGRPRREGRAIGAILSPTPEVVKAINDAKRLREKEKKKAKAESLAKREADIAAGIAVAAIDDDDDEDEDEIIGGVLDGIDLDDDDDDFDDDDDMDASLDELLGSSKETDDLFA
jgi:translation initiation factor IF-3